MCLDCSEWARTDICAPSHAPTGSHCRGDKILCSVDVRELLYPATVVLAYAVNEEARAAGGEDVAATEFSLQRLSWQHSC